MHVIVMHLPDLTEEKNMICVSILFALEVYLSVQAVESDTESRIVEWVARRQFRDVYFFINSSTTGTNCGDKNTYLISEERCVTDEELFIAGCSDAIVPTSSQDPTTITGFDSSSVMPTSAYLQSASYIEMFKFNGTNQPVNSSLCYISSLEVYRGREQAIEISHQGFSLTDNGSIKATIGGLGYDLEDYIGELYRMNVSCSGGGLPESGCLFFKVTATGQNQQNSGYVTNAKFNCTVPGTLYDFIEECSITTTPVEITTDSTMSAILLVTTTNSDSSDSIHNTPPSGTPAHTSFGTLLLVSLIGDVAIAVILAISVVIICVIIRFKVGRQGRPNTQFLSTSTACTKSRPQEAIPDHRTEASTQIPEVSANTQNQEGSSQDIPSQNPTYINLDPDHCHPVKNPAYAHVSSL